MGFTTSGQSELTVYLERLFEIISFKDIGVTTLTIRGHLTSSVM